VAWSDPERRNQWKREWYAKNAERVQAERKAKGHRENEKQRRKERRRTDPEFAERQCANARRSSAKRRASGYKRPVTPYRDFSVALKVKRSISIRIRKALGPGCKGGRALADILGYDMVALRAHMEAQFARGMSWDNFGEWHIDHIVPVRTFHFESVDSPELRACWALSNLRPLWATDNQKKGAARTHLL
jgi:hypothetical protein